MTATAPPSYRSGSPTAVSSCCPTNGSRLLLASIAALLANQWRGEDDTPATPADFMPWLPEDDDDEKPTDMVAMIEHLNMVFGGDDLRESVSQETTWAP